MAIRGARQTLPVGPTYTDLLLVPAVEWAADDEEFLAHPPVVGLIEGDARSRDLGGGISLEFIEDSRALMDACERRGENFRPARQYGQRYTFVRRNAPEPSGRWDGDGALMACLALSRLVRATAADTHYAARIEESAGRERVVAPVKGGFGRGLRACSSGLGSTLRMRSRWPHSMSGGSPRGRTWETGCGTPSGLPPVVLKLASTGYSFVRYYTGTPAPFGVLSGPAGSAGNPLAKPITEVAEEGLEPPTRGS